VEYFSYHPALYPSLYPRDRMVGPTLWFWWNLRGPWLFVFWIWRLVSSKK